MAVSKHIIDLVNLALLDRVITFKERETIVKEALKGGVPEAEINAFMDNMLAQRLKSYTKEELRHCPTCGAQIPLISDQCLFCGTTLEKLSGANTLQPPISGKAADIIRSENLKTVNEQTNIKNCPDCGAPFPLVSNICPSCGHVLHARRQSELNIKNLITNINNSTNRIRSTYKPSFFDVLKFHSGTIMMFVGIIVLVTAFSYETATAGCMLLTAIPLAIFGFKQKMKKPELSPVTIADEHYYNAVSEHNQYVRLTETIYGDNPEARKYISELGGEIQKAERKRRTNRLMLFVFVAIVTIIVIIPLFVTPSVQTYYKQFLDDDFTIFETATQLSE